MLAAPAIELRDRLELRPLRVFVASMPWMGGRGAGIPRIAAVVFEKVEAGFRDELLELGEVLDPPLAPEAWRRAEDRLRTDDVVLLIDMPAGKEGIAAEPQALR